MFEAMLVKTLKPKEILWDNPKYINFKLNKSDEKFDNYALLKGADNFIHKQMELKPGTSKEVFKKSESICNQLKDIRSQKAADNPDSRYAFSLDKESVVYLVDDYKNVVDIFDANDKDNIKEFEEKLEKFILDITTTEKTRKFYTDGKGGLVKLICYDAEADLPEQDYTPVVLIEYNNEKSQYKVFTGILIYKSFTFVPSISSYLEADKLSDFIKYIDIEEALNYATENANNLFEAYKTFESNPVEVSARELISILKKVGYKLQLKTDDQLDVIENISDETSNEKIQNFFNTFTLITGETAHDILSLSELKKIFRYNKLTLLEVLGILSKEYLTYDGSKITADILGSIVFNLYDKQNDKRQAQSIKDEIETE